MIGLFWNIRGLNGPIKCNKLKELIRANKPDFISISESKKEDFTPLQLEVFDSNSCFRWNWLPANNTAGGILIGIREDLFDIVCCDLHTYSVSCLLRNKQDNSTWRLISVYGTAYDQYKVDFINELHNLLAGWTGPTLVGGDFNLIREASEKSTGLINQHWADLFNDWINKFGLLELKINGRKYTWGNNQDNLVMATIDRVFMSTDWAAAFTNVHLKALPRLGSDHTPLIVDTCAFSVPKEKVFRFEKWFLEVEGFREIVCKAWNTKCCFTKAIDVWQFNIRNTRRAIKGWCANYEAEQGRSWKEI
jgi:exonuclease III